MMLINQETVKNHNEKKEPIKLYNGHTIKEMADAILPGKPATMSVKYPCDLRASINVKMAEASPFTTTTAYVNNAGTLAHIVIKNQDWFIRMKIRNNIKGFSLNMMMRVICNLLNNSISFNV